MAQAETFHPVSDKTARRVAEAVERYAGTDPKKSEIKEFLDEQMLMKIKNAIVAYADHAYGSNGGNIMTYPYENFLRAKRGLDVHGIGTDYIALLNLDYIAALMKEAKVTADANVAKVLNNGIIDNLAGVPVLGVSGKIMPSGCAFIIMTKALYDLIYGLYSDGTILDGSNLDTLIKEHNREILMNGILEELKFFETKSEPSATRNKTLFSIVNHEKEKTTNRLYYLTARNMDSLPVPVYGEALAMSSSQDPWYNAVEMQSFPYECTPNSAHTVYIIVETLSTNIPVGYSYGGLNINNG